LSIQHKIDLESVQEKYHDLIMKLNNNLKKNLNTTDIQLTEIELNKLRHPILDVKEKGYIIRQLLVT